MDQKPIVADLCKGWSNNEKEIKIKNLQKRLPKGVEFSTGVAQCKDNWCFNFGYIWTILWNQSVAKNENKYLPASKKGCINHHAL